MGKLITMIPTSETNSLFIYGVTQDNELVFRTTYNSSQLRKELMQIHDGICYFGAYHLTEEVIKQLPLIEN